MIMLFMPSLNCPLSVFLGDVPLDVLTQIVATISDPSAMLGPEVKTQILFSFFFLQKKKEKEKATDSFG